MENWKRDYFLLKKKSWNNPEINVWVLFSQQKVAIRYLAWPIKLVKIETKESTDQTLIFSEQ